MSIHVGDIGLILTLTIKDQDDVVVDVSSASTKQIRVRDSTGTLNTNAATFTTNGTDGKITYTTVSGDTANAGTYNYEAHVVITAGTFTSDSLFFNVIPVI